MKEVIEKSETTINPIDEDHVNSLTVKFIYEKGDPTPSAINIETHCTVADQLLGFIRIGEMLFKNKGELGGTVSDFVGRMLRLYADAIHAEEDEEKND